MDPEADQHDSEHQETGEEEKKGEQKNGRRKIKIELIEDKSRRHITFSKRKLGIMKKAWELATLTGTQVLLLVASETGHVYTFATPKLQPLITKPEGKNLIQACLNAPDPQATGSMPSRPPRFDGAGNAEFEEQQQVPQQHRRQAQPQPQGGFPQQYNSAYGKGYFPGAGGAAAADAAEHEN